MDSFARILRLEALVKGIKDALDRTSIRLADLDNKVRSVGQGQGGGGGGGVLPVQLPSGGLAAGSPASPTSGTAVLYEMTGTGGAQSATGISITVYNELAVVVPPGSKTGFVTQKAGLYYVVSWEC